MENALQVFSYNNQQLRTTEIDGETWLVAKDVCDILEIVNHRDAVQTLDEDEKRDCTQNCVLMEQIACNY